MLFRSNVRTWLVRRRPWRWLITAIVLLAISSTLQFVLMKPGAQLYFAMFFPAVFIAGLLAGGLSASLTAVLSVPLVWWIFIPPRFEFGRLSATDSESLKAFLLGGILLVLLSDVVRAIVAFKQEPEGHGGDS